MYTRHYSNKQYYSMLQFFILASPFRFKPSRTFGDISPPPPAVDYNVGKDFLEVKWNNFPEDFKFGTTVETGILYRETNAKYEYQLKRITKENNFTLNNLKANTSYEILVTSVNSNAMYPGTMDKIKVKTIPGVERIKTSFCSSLYSTTKLPNRFGHKTQDEAINSMHQFGPILQTDCASDLKAFICSAYLPNYVTKQETIQPPCKTLCENVFKKCSYAITKLKFKWPEKLQCSKLNNKEPCYRK